MKKLFSLILMVSLFISCNETTKKNDGYVISGTADGVYNGIRVYLKTIDERGRDFYQDTAVVVDGKFKFEGKIDKFQCSRLNPTKEIADLINKEFSF